MRPRCLEAQGGFCNNRHAVNKLLTSSFLAVLLATAGCQKSADLGRMQEETLAVVKTHASELEIEQRRADNLLQRGRQVSSAPGVNDAGKLLTEARARLEQLRGAAQQAPTAVAAAAKTGDAEEVQKVNDELMATFDDGIAHVRADLDAVESWVAIAESAPKGAQPPAPPAPPAEPATPPAPTEGTPGAGSAATPGAGSAAAPATGTPASAVAPGATPAAGSAAKPAPAAGAGSAANK